MANEKKVKFTTKATNWVAFWGARVLLAIAAVAGVKHLIAGVDPIIAWPIAIVLVAYLIKETIKEDL